MKMDILIKILRGDNAEGMFSYFFLMGVNMTAE